MATGCFLLSQSFSRLSEIRLLIIFVLHKTSHFVIVIAPAYLALCFQPSAGTDALLELEHVSNSYKSDWWRGRRPLTKCRHHLWHHKGPDALSRAPRWARWLLEPKKQRLICLDVVVINIHNMHTSTLCCLCVTSRSTARDVFQSPPPTPTPTTFSYRLLPADSPVTMAAALSPPQHW